MRGMHFYIEIQEGETVLKRIKSTSKFEEHDHIKANLKPGQTIHLIVTPTKEKVFNNLKE